MKNLKFYLLIFTVSSSVILLSFMLLPKEEAGGEQLFEEFISQFDKAELPYEITTSTVLIEKERVDDGSIQIKSTDSDKIISHRFSVFISGLARSMYSRMPPNRHYFKDVVYENENFVLVTYGIRSYMSRTSNSVDEYVLASYNKDPKIKDFERLLSLKTVTKNGYYQLTKSVIGEDLLMIKTVVSKRRRYVNDKMETYNETATERYKITEDGKIKTIITKRVPPKKGTYIRAN